MLRLERYTSLVVAAALILPGCAPRSQFRAVAGFPQVTSGPSASTGAISVNTLSVGHIDVAPDGTMAVVSGVRGGFRPEGGKVRISISSEGSVGIVDLASMKLRSKVAEGTWPGAVLWLPSEKAVVAVVGGALRLFPEEGPSRELVAKVDDIVFSKRRDAALIRVEGEDRYRLIALPTGRELSVLSRPAYLDHAQLLLPSSDEPMAVFIKDGFARLRRLATGAEISLVEWGDARGELRTADVAPSGRSLALGSSNAGLVLLSLGDSGATEQPVPVSHGQVNAVAVSDDGRLVAWGGVDATVQLFDTATGRQHADLGHHRLPILAVAFDATGTTLLTASFDSTRRWSIGAASEGRTGEPQ